MNIFHGTLTLLKTLIWLASLLTVFSIFARSFEIGDEIKLMAPDGKAQDHMGYSVDISGDTV